MSKIVFTGQAALDYVVALHYSARRGTVAITEVVSGIDVDNAGRFYSSSYSEDYTTMLWTILNYLSGTKSSVAEYFSAYVVDGSLTEFHIHTDLDDSESRGIRFEFVYS